MEDYCIVDLYWERNEKAITESDRKYGHMLTGISYSLLSSYQDAEECVNDTYNSAWNRMPTERPDCLGAFLAKIVRCISIDCYRSQHRQKRGGVDSVVSELSECIPYSETPADQLENGRLTEALNRFLRSLEPEKRAMFIQRYFFSHSITQIASQLGVSNGKIKTTLSRLRVSLKRMLEKEGLM